MCMFDPVKVDLKEDLIVYKYLHTYWHNGTVYYVSPFYGRNGNWVKGEKAYPWPVAGSLILTNNMGRKAIEGGVFHSYKYLKDAREFGSALYNSFPTVICRFRIPKDATVYAGVQANGTPTYASTSIIFEAELDHAEITNELKKRNEQETGKI